MRVRILVVVVTVMMVVAAGGALPAVAQPYPDLGFIDEIVDKLVEGANDECGWYWDERYGWQYWCWSPYHGWYLPDGCVNQAWQQNNGRAGAANYSYQSCDASS